jgi:hypothetical protein
MDMEQKWTSEVHANDNEGKSFKCTNNPSELLKFYYELEVGESILVPANIINSFFRAMESVNETNFMILPMNQKMRRMIYPYFAKETFCYVIVKIYHGECRKIDSITYSPRINKA